MKLKIGLSSVLIISLLIAGTWYWQTQTGVSVPDVALTSIKGETLHLGALKGKPALVTFWATDCPGCIEEIPDLISLHQQFASRGLTIIAVSMQYDPPNHVVALAENRQLPYFVALDPDGQAARAFGDIKLTPTTFLIDRDGQIVLQKLGAFDRKDLQQRLEKL